MIFNGKPVHFVKTELELNRNLVAIIGGRGTGKSILLSAIAKMFNKNDRNSRVNEIEIKDNFEISYTKQDGSTAIFSIENENNLDYLHVHQSEVKEIAEKPEELHKEIQTLLGIKDHREDATSETERRELLNKIQELEEWFTQKDIDGNLINTKDYNERMIKKNEDFIRTVTTEKNELLIKEYRENNIILGNVETSIENLEELSGEINKISVSIISQITKVNEILDEKLKIPLIQFSPQLIAIEKALKQKNDQLKVISSNNETIKAQFQEAGIEGDIPSLLDKVRQYQEEIDSFKGILTEIERKESELSVEYGHRSSIAEELEKELLDEITQIKVEWTKLKDGRDGWTSEQTQIVQDLLSEIEIYGDVHFDINKFYSSIGGFLNRNRFRSTTSETSDQKIRKTLNVEKYSDFLRLIKNEKIINFQGEQLINLQEFLNIEDLFNRNSEKELINLIFYKTLRQQYLYVIAKTKYKGKEPAELSVGQRGTFYVCLKLATDPFLTPFVFDQPEDDLDNSFIMKNLVPIFKKIKKYRQIIVVTHNANIVVNADAEQIIVANNEGEQLSYKSGSLEHTLRQHGKTGIRELVCNILEGGEPAFKKRELKYGIRG